MYSTRNNTEIGWQSRLRPYYSVGKKNFIQGKEELFHHQVRRVSHGICTPKVQTLFGVWPFKMYTKFALGARIFRWLLLFQEYDFEVIVNLEQLNRGPNHLSCIETREDRTNFQEALPDT